MSEHIVDRDALAEALFGGGTGNGPAWTLDEAESVADALLASGVVQDAANVRRAVAEDAWDKGYAAGFSNAMRRMSDEPKAPTSPNPYRAAARDDDPQEARP